jgi:hypothetical protein
MGVLMPPGIEKGVLGLPASTGARAGGCLSVKNSGACVVGVVVRWLGGRVSMGYRLFTRTAVKVFVTACTSSHLRRGGSRLPGGKWLRYSTRWPG